MSTRALRRLRESKGIGVGGGIGLGVVPPEEEVDDDDDDDGDDGRVRAVEFFSAATPSSSRKRAGTRARGAGASSFLDDDDDEDDDSENKNGRSGGEDDDDDDDDDDDEGNQGTSSSHRRGMGGAGNVSVFLLHADDSSDDDDDDKQDERSTSTSSRKDSGLTPQEGGGARDGDRNLRSDGTASAEEWVSGGSGGGGGDDDDDDEKLTTLPLPPKMMPPANATEDGNGTGAAAVAAAADDDDDWDAILEEFQSNDVGDGTASDGATAAVAAASSVESSVSFLLLDGLEWNDVDVERARSSSTAFAQRGHRRVAANQRARNSSTNNNRVDGEDGIEDDDIRTRSTNHNRSRRKKGGAASGGLLFGNPEPAWNRHTPPTYVGGGIGVGTLRDLSLQRTPSSDGVGLGGAAGASEEDLASPQLGLPWPYCDSTLIARSDTNADPDDDDNNNNVAVDCLDTKRWYTFLASDAYRRDLADYRDVIERSGDVTSLLLFVLHHPYCVPALLQASAVLEQTGRPRHALSMLKRALWVLDSAWQWSAARQLQIGRPVFMDGSGGGGDNNVDGGINSCFFRAVQALIKASSRAGLPRTCWAFCRLLLSLDPLRDPTGVLLVLDHYALACNTSEADEWFVAFVQANTGDGSTQDKPASGAPVVPIRIWYRDEQDPRLVYSGTLFDLPNALYSYALALWRLSLDQNHPIDLKNRADAAMQRAVARFPSVVVLLLDAGNADTRARTVRRDWTAALDFCVDYDRAVRYLWRTTPTTCGKSDDAIVRAATEQAVDHVSRIYARRNALLWSRDEGSLQFMYDNLKKVQESQKDRLAGVESLLPSPALMRYAAFEESDFDDRVQLLPPDAEVVDVALLEEAMRIDPNRRRLIRRPHRRREGGDDDHGEAWDADHPEWFGAGPDGRRRRAPHWLGGPPTGVIDPDWPLVEVLWRSFLPWNRVEGVVPPRR